MKFKVGDKVRVLDHAPITSTIRNMGLKHGDTFIVHSIEGMRVRCSEEIGGYFYEHELELVDSPEKSAIEVKHMVEVTIKEDTFLLTIEEAQNLHAALEKAGV